MAGTALPTLVGRGKMIATLYLSIYIRTCEIIMCPVRMAEREEENDLSQNRSPYFYTLFPFPLD
jgi:hypothetical protein